MQGPASSAVQSTESRKAIKVREHGLDGHSSAVLANAILLMSYVAHSPLTPPYSRRRPRRRRLRLAWTALIFTTMISFMGPSIKSVDLELIRHCTLQNFTIETPIYESAASGGKLGPWLAQKLLCFLAWIEVTSLQDIVVNDNGGKFLQKCNLHH